QVIECKYKQAENFGEIAEGMACVTTDKKSMFIDKTGKETDLDHRIRKDLEIQWIRVKVGEEWNHDDGFDPVYETKYGVVDKDDKVIVDFKYDEIQNFSEGIAIVKLGELYGCVDTTGKEIVPCKYKRIETFSDGMAVVVIDNRKCGYIDKTGKEILLNKYDRTDSFSEGLARVTKDGKCGYINNKGEEVVPCKYEFIGPFGFFKEGRAFVKNCETHKYGYIDKTGKEVIPCQFTEGLPFSEGLALVRDEHGYFNYIDKTGEIVIKHTHPYVKSFHNGLAIFFEGFKHRYINKRGEILTCIDDYKNEKINLDDIPVEYFKNEEFCKDLIEAVKVRKEKIFWANEADSKFVAAMLKIERKRQEALHQKEQEVEVGLTL
ncbi:MAG: WG repeat-containing protein, partial [Clostridia bacterium]|nr:WG repeat-containing protein [Clostridia bacterium]